MDQPRNGLPPDVAGFSDNPVNHAAPADMTAERSVS
jgi:hypothetical protein